jgi:pimeloyl-ACP methyl ester carboxylesterase
MRRIIAAVVVVLVVLLAVNTIVTNNETKDAEADIGQILQLPGGDLHVRQDGPPRGQAIVLLHGFAGSLHWWSDVAERLSRDFRVVRIDFLGHGGSEKPEEGYSMGNQARLVAGALGQLDIQRAVVAGHSMGGAVATALAELDPRVVDGLALVGAAADEDAGELPFLARLGFVPVIGEAIRRVVPDSVVRDGLGNAFAGDFDVPDQFVDDFNQMTYTSYDSSHDESADFQEDRAAVDRLAEARKPLLVIYGTEDDIVDPDSQRKFEEVPGARLHALPATGHSPMVEEPAETSNLIAGFARRLERRR